MGTNRETGPAPGWFPDVSRLAPGCLRQGPAYIRPNIGYIRPESKILFFGRFWTGFGWFGAGFEPFLAGFWQVLVRFLPVVDPESKISAPRGGDRPGGPQLRTVGPVDHLDRPSEPPTLGVLGV